MRRGAFDFYVAISGSAEKATTKNFQRFLRLAGQKMRLVPFFYKNLADNPEARFGNERSALPLRQ